MKKQNVYLHHKEYESEVFEDGSEAYDKAIAKGWSLEREATTEEKVAAPTEPTAPEQPQAQKPYNITYATDDEVFGEAERRTAIRVKAAADAANPILPKEEAPAEEETVVLSDLTVAQLKAIASEAGITGHKSMKHAELIDAILATEDGTDAK